MKISRFFTALTALAMAAYAVLPGHFFLETANAADYGQLTYAMQEDGTLCITGCAEDAVMLDIPAEIDGMPVTAIKRRAFAGCSGLKEIHIPESVTDIGEDAFLETQYLALRRAEDPFVVVNGILTDAATCSGEIVIPDSVRSIGPFAFRECPGLTAVTIPDSVTDIGWAAFDRCKDLVSVVIPESVTSIDFFAFDGCTDLEQIHIPDSVTYIGGDAFSRTKWLSIRQKESPLVIVNTILIDGTACSGETVIPDGVTSIAYGAFSGCYGLTSAVIPGSVTSIGDKAFYRCKNLAEVVISDGVTEIGSNAFSMCENLTELSIPDSVEHIGTGVFSYCSSLKTVSFPDNPMSMGEYTFNQSAGLTEITIPDCITEIGHWAFFLCPNLENITVLNPDCVIYDSGETICTDTTEEDSIPFYSGTITGYDNSTAQAYAETYGYTFISLGKAPEPFYGDADESGAVDIGDVVVICKASMGTCSLTRHGFLNADVDRNQTADTTDAACILQSLIGLIELPL